MALSTAMSASSPGVSNRLATLRFCASFLLLIAVVSSVTSTRAVGVPLHEHLTRLIAACAAPLLRRIGDVSVSGPYLTFEGFHAVIEASCDGLQPAYIYVCAVLAFPSRWRDKAWGLLIGIPGAFLINLLRVVSVVACGAYWPQLFERVHLYGWQALVIALTMALWFFWAETFVRADGMAHS